MSKPGLSFFALIAVLAAAVWFASSLWYPGDADHEPVTSHQGQRSPPDLESSASGPLLETRADVPEGREGVAVPGSTSVTEIQSYPRSRVFGSVTDGNGQPLPGVVVQMHSVGERWVEAELYPDELEDFATETNAQGVFEIEAPLPTSDWVSLTIRPSEFRTLAGRDFGPAGGRDQEPLRPGENDLGTFVLGNAGAFEGSVLDEAGAPVRGARVALDGSFPGEYSLGAVTLIDGNYRVGRIPPGRYSTAASAKGFLSDNVADVEVLEGQCTTGIDFVLRRAPSISGRVVDPEGHPLENVKLWGWPASSGRGAGAMSAADGTFTMYLPQDEPYSLSAELDGYEEFDTKYQKYFPPGTGGIEIVLGRPNLITYIVRDATTDIPVERFGLKIIRVRTDSGTRSSSSDDEPAPIEEHPGGEARMSGDPRYDDYTIVALGYGPQRGSVDHDGDGERQQTIRLVPAGSIQGRFVHDSTPLASATIRILADRIPLTPNAAEEQDDPFSDDWGTDLDEFAGRTRQHRGDASGFFRIDDLAAGTYELTFSAPGAAPRTIERVLVKAGNTTELATVEAHAPSGINGTLTLSGGLPPGGLFVALGDESWADDESVKRVDRSGSFAFEGLAAGTHYVWVTGDPKVLVPGDAIEVELARGEVKKIQIDLSDRIPCELEVLVWLNGSPTPGLRVSAVPVDGKGRAHGVGMTDATGIVVGSLECIGAALIEVHGQAGLFVGRAQETVELFDGGRTQLELGFEAGHLFVATSELVDPAEESPRFGVLRIERLDREDDWQTVILPLAEWRKLHETRRADLGWVEPGQYRMHLQSVPQPLRGDVVILAGKESVCTLR